MLSAIPFMCSSRSQLKQDRMNISAIFISLVALTGITVSNANPEYIELESFDVGQCIKVVYTAPTTGRTTLQLLAADGTIVLTADYRKHWGGNPSTGQPWQDMFILNSKIGGSFGTRQDVTGILTTPGTDMALNFCANDTEFIISLNNKDIATYTYRTPVTTVSKVEFFDRDYDSVLKEICVTY